MKKLLHCCLLPLLFLFLLPLSCSFPAEESPAAASASQDGSSLARLTVSASFSSAARTILPSGDSSALTSLQLTYRQGEGEEKTLEAASLQELNDSLSSLSFAPGTYTFILSASLNGSSYSGGAADEGSDTKTVEAGENALAFSLSPSAQATGYGGFSLTLRFAGRTGSVGAQLQQMDGSLLWEEETLSVMEDDSGFSSVTYEKSLSQSSQRLASGYYRVIVSFYTDSSKSGLLNSYRETVHISPGMTSSAVRTLDLTGLYTISYDYNGGSLAAGQTAPAVYSVKSGSVQLPLAVYTDSEGKAEKIFAGWYEDAAFSGTYVTEIAADRAADLALYARWISPVLYVAENGSDRNDGLSQTSPLASLQAAVGEDGVLNAAVADYSSLNTLDGESLIDSLAWTVYMSGTVRGSTEIGSLSAASLLVKGSSGAGSDILDAQGSPGQQADGRVLKAASSVPITLANLSVTNGYAAWGQGGGIQSYGSLTLDSCSVYGNTAASEGNGVWVGSGSFILTGASLISDDIYLPDGSCVTVGGALTADGTVATLTPASYTAGTRVLAEAESGLLAAYCDRFAVSDGGDGSEWGVDSGGLLQQKQEAGLIISVPVYISDGFEISASPSYDDEGELSGYTFTATAGYETYVWIFAGILSAETSGNTLTLPISKIDATGSYRLLVSATAEDGSMATATYDLFVQISE